ncbi:hypothetical protein CABS02_09214 [Colletotrichum abscissum]|uniref:Uncharacterized protein n=1 Tax=Colletotrichum abscissum TaxID=1671311 RepID=A0A9P9XAR0_9PEZI|nr:hypothetical protein CABS02_09214 [Colletotrichum abscissum]
MPYQVVGYSENYCEMHTGLWGAGLRLSSIHQGVYFWRLLIGNNTTLSTNSGGRMCLDSPGIVCVDIGVQSVPLGVLAVLLRRQHGSVNALHSSLSIDYLNESVWLIDFDTLIFSNIRLLELSNV